jgi:23S rRNA (uridine2552-2'-O)-methyltransferase
MSFSKQVVDSFDVLKTAKPAASRARSKEVFLIGQGRKKHCNKVYLPSC